MSVQFLREQDIAAQVLREVVYAGGLVRASDMMSALDVLEPMTRAMADAATEPRELLEAVARQTAEAMTAFCAFMQLSGDTLHAVAHAMPSAGAFPDGVAPLLVRSVALDSDALMARAVRDGATLRVGELTEAHLCARYADPAERALVRRIATRDLLFVPVRARGSVLGVLALVRAGEDAAGFEPVDVGFAERLADLAALSLVNSRLLDEARDRARRQELVGKLTAEFGRASHTYQDLLDVIAKEVGEALADSCAIRMLQDDRQGFTSHVAAYNRDAALAARHREALRALGPRIQGGLAARVFATRASVLVPRVDLAAATAEALPGMRSLLELLAPASLLAVPICVQREPIAVLLLSRCAGRAPFTTEDQRLAEEVAAHAAIAITNARLIETSARTTDRLRLLTEASAAFAASVGDPRGIIDTVARRLNQLIGGLCVIEIADDATPTRELAADQQVIALPMCAGGEVLGHLTLSRGEGGTYSEDDRRFAQELVTHAALAIRNSRLITAVQRELAERERAERALRESEERLLHAQKMEAIGRLAGGVAHDFNNLLSVVLSSCDFIAEGELPPVVLEDVAQIRRAGERAASLTRQLLAFSRQQPIERQVLDLNAQVEQVHDMLERVLGEDIALSTRLAPDAGTIVADATHIEQVLMNLAINARDAMPRGGTLGISTAAVELDERDADLLREIPAGPYIRLSIRDTGEGMTEETLARIFEPFFTTKPRGKGTGLGLATVFGIVSQNGGAIRARSRVGRGTTFEIWFPRTERKPSTRPAIVPSSVVGGRETILVAEDDDTVRALVVEILTRNGYRVIETSNGLEALAAYARHEGAIDLVLSDVVMPVMSGGELAEQLRLRAPAIKVLFMSGYADDAVLQNHPLAPGSPLLAKPLQPVPVLRKVREVIDS